MEESNKLRIEAMLPSMADSLDFVIRCPSKETAESLAKTWLERALAFDPLSEAAMLLRNALNEAGNLEDISREIDDYSRAEMREELNELLAKRKEIITQINNAKDSYDRLISGVNKNNT